MRVGTIASLREKVRQLPSPEGLELIRVLRGNITTDGFSEYFGETERAS